jgi:hypothetical protein
MGKTMLFPLHTMISQFVKPVNHYLGFGFVSFVADSFVVFVSIPLKSEVSEPIHRHSLPLQTFFSEKDGTIRTLFRHQHNH